MYRIICFLSEENPNDYSYPTTGHMYGQSFLCISVPAKEVNAIGLQLVYNEAHVYNFKISENLRLIISDFVKIENNRNFVGCRSLYPNLVDASASKKIESEPYWHVANIHTTGGVSFQSFAKSRYFANDLYQELVAPTLGVDLYVEAWRMGTGVLPSSCTQTRK